MPASPLQYDHQPGFDLASLAQVERTQLMQALSKMGPLSNIGGIIAFDGGGGLLWPGVTDNPRFWRYLWIDTNTTPPTIKCYDQSGVDGYANWVSATLADGSVTTAKLDDEAVRTDKMSIANPAGGDWAANWVCRIDPTGTFVEYCSPDSIFAVSELPRTAIDVSGAPAGTTSFLKRDASAGQTTWAKPTFSDLAAGTIGISQIEVSASNFQVIATVGGVNVFDYIQNILEDGVLPIAKLVGGAAYQVLRTNSAGTAKEWGTLPFNRSATITDDQAVGTSLPLGADTVYDDSTMDHGLGTRPTLVIPVLVCTSNDLGYVVGHEIPLHQVWDNTAASQLGRPAFTCLWNATRVKFYGLNIAALRATMRNDTGASGNITDTNWRLKYYAFV